MGIRKVLGASAPAIVSLLIRDFIKWVLLSNLIAWPLAWIIMRQWLNGFAYRMPLRSDLFIFSSMLTLTIAVLTVLFQAMKSAFANPADALKYE